MLPSTFQALVILRTSPASAWAGDLIAWEACNLSAVIVQEVAPNLPGTPSVSNMPGAGALLCLLPSLMSQGGGPGPVQGLQLLPSFGP